MIGTTELIALLALVFALAMVAAQLKLFGIARDVDLILDLLRRQVAAQEKTVRHLEVVAGAAAPPNA